LAVRAELQRRGLDPARFEPPRTPAPWDGSDLCVLVDAAVRGGSWHVVREALAHGENACAVRLPGFGGLLAHRTQPGKVLADEFADRVRVIACLTGTPFLVTSDDAVDRLGEATWRDVRSACRADADDTVVLLWGPRSDLVTAAHEVLLRARDAFDGVPSETRQARADGTTGFERILPGPQRMYPDTDMPPLPIPDAWVVAIDAAPVERPWQREDRYRAAGLAAACAQRLAVAPWAGLFDQLLPMPQAVARRMAWAILLLRRQLRAVGCDVARVRALVQAVVTGEIHPDGLRPLFEALLAQPERAATELLAAHRRRAGDSEHEGLLQRLSRDLKKTRIRGDAAARRRWAMGQALGTLPRGSVDPAVLAEKIDALVSE
jgi:glutamyl-tRNA(Gln) amidotransferase subunit E